MNTQMIFQEISSKNLTTKKTLTYGSSDKKSGVSFNDLLKSIPNNNSAVSETKGQRTYVQVVNRAKAAAINFNSGTANIDETQELTEDAAAVNDNQKLEDAANSVINGIAALLGIDGSSLKQLMTQLNIKPEDLLDAAKIDDIISQLSLKLGLSAEQQQVLATSVQQFSKLAKDAMTATEKDNNSWVVVEGVSFEVSKKEDKLQSMTHLDDDIKQLANSIKKENASLFENIPEKFANLLKEFGIAADTDKNAKSIREENKDNANKKELKSEDEPKISKLDSEGTSANKADLLSEKDTGKRSEFSLVQSNDLVNQTVQKDDFVSKLQTVATQQRVVRNDLMKQVVEQAKVFVDENRSEMVMQLKPDSLGKLTLKIVTENGIVAAKFVAENQQVKQVLESNMQTLKDSLEKQGMSIQSVSVSVGQEGSQGFSQREAFERRNSRNTRITSDELAYIAGMDEDFLDKTNPYEISDNSIDVIA